MSVAAAAIVFFQSQPDLIAAFPGGIGPGLVYSGTSGTLTPFVRVTNLGETGREAFGGKLVSPYLARDRFQFTVVCDTARAAEDANRLGKLLAGRFDPAILQLEDGTCLNLENELMMGPIEDPKRGPSNTAVYTYTIRYACFKSGAILRR